MQSMTGTLQHSVSQT